MADITVRLLDDQSVRLKFIDNGDGTHSLPTAQLGALAGVVGTDRSIVATTTSQSLMAANATRRRFYVKNDAAVDVWINPSATATAVAGAGNIKIPAGGGYFDASGSSSAWSIIAISGTAAITAREF